MADSMTVCGVVFPRGMGTTPMHVDIVITDPYLIEAIRDKELTNLSLDVGPITEWDLNEYALPNIN
jgi:hypothetical protein